MVRIDGKLTDASFQVISESIHKDEDFHNVYTFCVDVFKLDPFAFDYISEVLADYIREKCKVKEDDRIYLQLNYVIDKRIGDITII